MPFFSVIIPTYNRLDRLASSIESVLNQDYKDFELIVIDDGSNDGTSTYLENLSQYESRLTFLIQDNSGVSRARNRGVELSQADWICFLDSDDWWLQKKLSYMHRHIKNNPLAKIIHTDENWFKNGTRHNQKFKHQKPNGYIFDKLVNICCVSMSTLTIYKPAFNTIGGFNENLRICEDHEFLLRASLKYRFSLIDKALTEKEGGRNDQLSSQHSLDLYRVKVFNEILTKETLTQKQRELLIAQMQRRANVFLTGAIKRNKQEDIKVVNSLLEAYQ